MAAKIGTSNIPKHIGLIPDGTRRWAYKNRQSLLSAYHYAMERVASFINSMFDQGVSSISLYLLSKENLKRPVSQLNDVFTAELHMFDVLLPPLINKYQFKVIHAGKLELLHRDYAERLGQLCLSTSSNMQRNLYLLAAYNPFDELCAAIENSNDKTVKLKDF